MKKNFFKKLSVLLAVALVITSVNVPSASAAAAPAWKATKTKLSVGNRYTYAVKNVTKYSVTFKSSNKAVARISKKGSALGVKAGSTVISAVVKNGSKTVKTLKQTLKVVKPVFKTSVDTMVAEDRAAFAVRYVATGATVKWSSSDKEIARVSQKGSVLAVAEGTVTITAKVVKNGVTLGTVEQEVAVTAKEVAVEATVITLSANTNTTVTVKLAAPFEGEVKASDFTFDNGLTVSNAVLGTSKDTVTLTTSAQTADTVYELSVKGIKTGKTFVGKAAEGNVFDIVSATARANTEVTVVLTDAPLRTLVASDFNISPGLAITSITTNNNIVSLKTSTQNAGVEYTITAAAGTGSAKFTGLAAVDTSGVIQNVELINLRQIKVSFTQPVRWAEAQLTSNYFFGLVDEATGDLSAASIHAIDGSTKNWLATSGSQDVTVSNPTVSYVIIESTKDSVEGGNGGSIITETVANGGLGLAYNKSQTLEVRGLKNATGGYVNNSQGAFAIVDTKAPMVEKATTNAMVNGLWNSNNKATSYLAGAYTIAADKAYLEVKFSEPVKDTTFKNANITDGDQANANFTVYVDGIDVTNSAVNANILAPAPTPDGNLVAQTLEVEAQKTFILDVTGLSRGKHTLKIVGATDLKGNVMAPNPYQTDFTVSDEVLTPQAAVKATVKEIKQVADNALAIDFDQSNVVVADATAGKAAPVTIEGAEFDGMNFQDIKALAESGLGIKDLKTDITSNPGIFATTYGTDAKTRWIVLFDADEYTNSNLDGNTLDYMNQQSVVRNVVIQNYAVDGAFALDPYYKGDVVRKEQVFTKDTKAPEAQNVVADVAAGKLYVTFTDMPFDGNIAEGAAEFGPIKVSRTDKNGVTTDGFFVIDADGTDKSVEVLATNTNLSAGKTLVIDVTKSANLVDTGKLFRESVYTVHLPQGSVTDVEEDLATVAITDGTVAKDYINVSGLNAIAAVSKSVSIPKDATATQEGLVPQTSKGLIQSGKEITAATGVGTATTVNDAVTDVGSRGYMYANPNFILVTFDGDVLESSALNKGNYKFNGAALPANSKVTFYTAEINANTKNPILTGTDANKENFVIIELPEGSVQKDGLYTIDVFNITNRFGKVMLPVSDSVALVDNTKPAIVSVKAIGSKQVELTMDELVDIPAATAALAKNNFTVTVNGVNLAVTNVTLGTTANKLVLTLSQDFSLATTPKITVTVKADNGKFYITDKATPANDIAAQVKSN